MEEERGSGDGVDDGDEEGGGVMGCYSTTWRLDVGATLGVFGLN